MNLDVEEANETQKLMHLEGDVVCDEEETKNVQSAASPVTSNKLSSGAASYTSKTVGGHWLSSAGNSSVNDSSKISYVNERRLQRENMRSNNNKPKPIPKDGTDVKHMEKALMGLLEDFQSGKLSAFSSGCSMEQMTHIRDQQEHLARLHFSLFSDIEKPPDEDFENNVIQDKMSQLVHSLEQLSTSIEHIHSTDNMKNANGDDENRDKDNPQNPQ